VKIILLRDGSLPMRNRVKATSKLFAVEECYQKTLNAKKLLCKNSPKFSGSKRPHFTSINNRYLRA
jgi:hypothetical protein